MLGWRFDIVQLFIITSIIYALQLLISKIPSILDFLKTKIIYSKIRCQKHGTKAISGYLGIKQN